ncbi:antibiotic biosynthesis monooxygenase [Ferrimonas sp. SCSIO 43195]|uniref:antibiotic biosynthesis monooxygenase n=1 Tax=Ferrimonas sp. SCSIO 43195 TaxID=2822844 RepID=UPI0020750853|nr:antibiotic biosynthesis monooxygenase [Ferrimonas sp. SCSIO 43195]USD39392.1 antibiotic biosynthesis monooxygenase [Ferrimonas sp. SCSIO 43195]
MYTVLYQWKIRSGKQQEFMSAWEEVTDYYLKNHEALGSRLHQIDDHSFAAYAQWASKADRDKAFASVDSPDSAIERMRACVVDRLDPIEMVMILDKLKQND